MYLWNKVSRVVYQVATCHVIVHEINKKKHILPTFVVKQNLYEAVITVVPKYSGKPTHLLALALLHVLATCEDTDESNTIVYLLLLTLHEHIGHISEDEILHLSVSLTVYLFICPTVSQSHLCSTECQKELELSGGRCRSAGNEDGSSGGKQGGAVQKTGLPTLQTTELEEQDKMPGEGGGHLGHIVSATLE